MRTILIVDDQETVRHVLKTMLDWCGFRAIEAAGGDEAVQMVEIHQERISGVLLDVVMPGSSGEATLAAMRRVRPGLPVVFMSGLEKDDLPVAIQDVESVAFIHKPCYLEELLKSLECVLAPECEAA